jgi:hypothetical protein
MQTLTDDDYDSMCERTWSPEELEAMIGPPTSRNEWEWVWILHPDIWDGELRLVLATGELKYYCDQGGAL